MKKPEVTVVIPYYNGRKYLSRAVSSVVAQEGVVLETMVVDDGSREPPDEILEPFARMNVTLVRQEHAGKGAALNRGIRNARAEVLCFLDQDDVMVEGRIRRQLGALALHPDVDAVHSDYERVFEDGTFLDRRTGRQAAPREHLHEMARGRSLISMQNLMFRKSVLVKLGGFSTEEGLTGLDDAEFFVRLICSGARLLYVPGVAARWVSHGENHSKSRRFQDARISFLQRLERLEEEYPLLAPELPYFHGHHRSMRGIYFLENGEPRKAVGELALAVRFRPFHWNIHYLLVKAIFRTLVSTHR